MIHTARFFNVLKRYFKRLRPGKPKSLVRTLAEEGKGERPGAPPVTRLNQTQITRPAMTDGGIQSDWQSDGYPVVYRYPVSSRESKTAPKESPDIDLVSLDDLEAKAEELTLPAETIESWVGAGILSPRETEIAERLIRFMRARDLKRSYRKTRSDA